MLFTVYSRVISSLCPPRPPHSPKVSKWKSFLSKVFAQRRRSAAGEISSKSFSECYDPSPECSKRAEKGLLLHTLCSSSPLGERCHCTFWAMCLSPPRHICLSLCQHICQRDYASSFIPGRREPEWVYHGVFIHSVISPFFIVHC